MAVGASFGAMRLCGPATLRTRWRAIAGLALLIALAGGVALGAAAGARRTDTAMGRFLTAYRPDNGEVQTSGPRALRAIAALPQVEDLQRSAYVALVAGPEGSDFGSIGFFVAGNRQTYRDINRPHVVAGRMFRNNRADEVVINELAARRMHLHVGSRLPIHAFTQDQLLAIFTSGAGHIPKPEGAAGSLRVMGIVRLPYDVQPSPPGRDVLYMGSAYGLLSPAFTRSPAGRTSAFETRGIGQVRLRPGADADRFTRDAIRVGGPGTSVSLDLTHSQTAATQRAIHVQAVALALFAALVALASVIVIGGLLAREVAAVGDRHGALRGLGLTRRGIMAVLLVPSAIATGAGVLGMLALAWLVSPLTPIGLARDAEIHGGLSFNLAILGLGAGILAALIFGRAVFAAWRATRHRASAVRQRPSAVGTAVSRSGFSIPATIGIGMALDPGPPSARVPVRPALAGAITGIAGVVAAVVFATSLSGLIDDPVRQGWNWDAVVGNPNDQGAPMPAYAKALRADPAVAAFTPIGEAQLRVNRRPVSVLSIGTGRGLVAPPLLEGRLPRTKDEIALGDETLRDAHVHLGQSVIVAGSGGRLRARVVGRVLLPAAASDAFNFVSSLRRGAIMTRTGIEAVGGDADPVTPEHLVALRFAPGVDQDRAVRQLQEQFGKVVLARGYNVDVANLVQINQLPLAFAVLLGLLALASIAYGLTASGRRRRHDFALFRTLGFTRHQLFATVSVQASTLGITALLVGIPFGIVTGRLLWIAVATAVANVDPQPVVPGIALLGLTAIGIVAVNLLAIRPARRAAGLHPAVVLRSE